MTRCKLCKLLGEKEHLRQEKALMKAIMEWNDEGDIQTWRKLEKAALAYGRKPRGKVKP